MKKQFTLPLSMDEKYLPNLEKHLSKHGLFLHNSANQTWVFKNESSFWEGWKNNPLKWEATIELRWFENNVDV